MFKNDNDSAIKSVIDDWYETNIKDKEEKLEDAIWCNDRRLKTGPLTSKDNRINAHSSFAPNMRNAKIPIEPSFSCNKRDSFTQNESSTGNGSLKNRVGLLTVDEIVLSGSGHVGYNISSYLNTGHNQWSMSPLGFFDEAGNGVLLEFGYILNGDVNEKFAVRPAISLKSGTKIISGNGSTSKPYVVE